MKQTTRKESELKVRIPTKEKEQLQSLAQKHGMTLSGYIRMKCFEHTNEWIRLIPTAVETWNTYNEIFQAVKESQNEALIQTIQDILNNCILAGAVLPARQEENHE